MANLDLAEATHEDFEPAVGEAFRLELPGDEAALALELARVEPRGAAGEGRQRVPFSLVFRGPGDPLLPQRIYALQNETLGSLDLFLVPIDARDGDAFYEAVFT